MVDGAKKSRGNGKVSMVEISLKEQVTRLEDKVDHMSETLNHINVILSERLSNHSARLQGLENAVSELRNSQF
jgi:hypothetical protein